MYENEGNMAGRSLGLRQGTQSVDDYSANFQTNFSGSGELIE